MPTGTRFFSFNRAIGLALGQLLIACGGEAVNTANGEHTGSGDDATNEAGGTETTGTSATVGNGAGGTGTSSGTVSSVSGAGTDTGTTGSSAELRDAARERAARFVNDYEVACAERKQVTFAGADATSAYPTRVLQSRGRPSPYAECAQLADADEKFACWDRLACDSEWWKELDWSQWSEGATVIEIVGVRPEQINVASTKYQSAVNPADPEGARIGYTSFYETPLEDPVPPGCHDCGYYWYLDPTPGGVALVLGPPMAGDLEGGLSFTELDLCLTE